MARALVTGATGFIGRHLSLHLLSTGWDVVTLHRGSSSAEVLSELRNKGAETIPFSSYDEVRELARASRPQVAFHLAAHYTRTHEATDIDALVGANIALGTQLLEGLMETGCVVVNAVSYLQFRLNEPVPFSLYSATKQAFVEVSRFYREKQGLDVRHVVLYDNFGPDDKRDKLIAKIATSLREGDFMALGPAQQRLNLLYVMDLVAGLVAAAQPGNPGIMSVKASQSVSVEAVVSALEDAAGRRLKKHHDNSRPISELVEHAGEWPRPIGWREEWPLKEGLAATYRSLEQTKI